MHIHFKISFVAFLVSITLTSRAISKPVHPLIDMIPPHTKLSLASLVSHIYAIQPGVDVDQEVNKRFINHKQLKASADPQSTMDSYNYYLSSADQNLCTSNKESLPRLVKFFSNKNSISKIKTNQLPDNIDALHCTCYLWATSNSLYFDRFIQLIKNRYQAAAKDRVLISYLALWQMKQKQFSTSLSLLLDLSDLDPIFLKAYKQVQKIYAHQQKSSGRVALDPI